VSEVHPSVCRICVAQCGLLVTVENGRVMNVRGDDMHPTSQGYTCSKGRALGSFHHGDARLDEPRLHSAAVSWDACLDDLAGRLQLLRADAGIDGAARSIEAVDSISLRSATGNLEVTAHVDPRIAAGTVSLTHGWDSPNVASIIDETVDPLTGQPIFTAFGVTLERAGSLT
jgi:anaerobic selenocysteine-containing dehydrogenase